MLASSVHFKATIYIYALHLHYIELQLKLGYISSIKT